MFFLLRCVFWLGLVFHLMDWPGGATPVETAKAAFGDAARSATSVAMTSAVPVVRDLCLTKPASCLALVGAPAALAEPTAAPETPAPPLPPRRPRGLS